MTLYDNVGAVEEPFAIALSEKDGEDASKEVSLKIKSVFPRFVKHLFIFFTPQYQPQQILQTITFTLKPQTLVGIQSPLLVFEDRIINKGVTALCINKEGVAIKEILMKSDDSQRVEFSIKNSLKYTPRENQFFFSLLSHQFSHENYLRGLSMALGKAFAIAGGGYMKRYAEKNYQLINNNIEEGIVNEIFTGIKLNCLSLSGFIPLGKPFTITKMASKRNMIMEINGRPAVNIYAKYLGEKFDAFIKNYLFTLYPLGIKQGRRFRLINILECLNDGSLVCVGDIKEKTQAHIMMFHYPSFMESLAYRLETLKRNGDGLIFMINSMVRKKILKDFAQEEIKVIKRTLGERCKLIGMYCDYSFFSDKETRDTNLEAGNLLLTQWQ
ncbi:MAG: FIST C-terminal domain-containing protein [Candidatus Omnitrophota bacterium]